MRFVIWNLWSHACFPTSDVINECPNSVYLDWRWRWTRDGRRRWSRRSTWSLFAGLESIFNNILGSVFFHQFFLKLQCQTVVREKQCKTLLHKKANCKILLNLTPDANFNNILRIGFFSPISFRQKITDTNCKPGIHNIHLASKVPNFCLFGLFLWQKHP